MARAKKAYFGEETQTASANAEAPRAKRKYTRRAETATAGRGRSTTRQSWSGRPRGKTPMVTISVPADYAFQLGLELGRANAL